MTTDKPRFREWVAKGVEMHPWGVLIFCLIVLLFTHQAGRSMERREICGEGRPLVFDADSRVDALAWKVVCDDQVITHNRALQELLR